MEFAVSDAGRTCTTPILWHLSKGGRAGFPKFIKGLREAVGDSDAHRTDFHSEYSYDRDEVSDHDFCEHAWIYATSLHEQGCDENFTKFGFQKIGTAHAPKTENDVTMWVMPVAEFLTNLSKFEKEKE
jgi:hypothetical protein